MAQHERVSSHMHYELLNWGRWCNHGPSVGPSQSLTVDRRYLVPEEERDPDSEPLAPSIPINHERARIVEEAWRKLPLTLRLVLREEYPRHDGKGAVAAARRLQLRVPEYQRLLVAASKKIEEAFHAVGV